MAVAQNIQVLNCDGVAINFDYSKRKLFLKTIKCLAYEEIGSSNYSYDQIGTYRFIFHINDGSAAPAIKVDEWYTLTFTISIAEWYRPEDSIRIELGKALKGFDIIDVDEVLNAFSYRKFYRLK